MKIRGSFCKRVVAPKTKFDKRSFRWKKSGKAFILVGCPKGKWQPTKSKCATGTRAYEILVPASGKACRVGRKTKKG